MTKRAMLPDHVKPYAETQIFTQDTLPAKLLKHHKTKENTWAELTICTGKLEYTQEGSAPLVIDKSEPAIIEPDIPHFIKPIGQVSFFLKFFR